MRTLTFVLIAAAVFMASAAGQGPVSSQLFYAEYHGHTVDDLRAVYPSLRESAGTGGVLWLAGDSSLDNKNWLYPSDAPDDKRKNPLTDPAFTGPAVNGYERVLTGRCVKDVAYALNAAVAEANSGVRPVAINTAVEESKLKHRKGGALLPQDEFLRDNLHADDVVVVSVGSNDIILAGTVGIPTPEKLKSLFYDQLSSYLRSLLAKTRPRMVIISMIYYPSIKGHGWPDQDLADLGYDQDPSMLQGLIRQVYDTLITKIQLEGTDTRHLPLFKVLDPETTDDYNQRVEPSVTGGAKMARAILEIVRDTKATESMVV